MILTVKSQNSRNHVILPPGRMYSIKAHEKPLEKTYAKMRSGFLKLILGYFAK